MPSTRTLNKQWPLLDKKLRKWVHDAAVLGQEEPKVIAFYIPQYAEFYHQVQVSACDSLIGLGIRLKKDVFDSAKEIEQGVQIVIPRKISHKKACKLVGSMVTKISGKPKWHEDMKPSWWPRDVPFKSPNHGPGKPSMTDLMKVIEAFKNENTRWAYTSSIDGEEESEDQDSELDAVQTDDYWEEEDEARADDEEEYAEEDGEGNEFKEPKDDYWEEEDKVRADDEEESEEQDSELDAVQTDDYWEEEDEARADDEEEYAEEDGEGNEFKEPKDDYWEEEDKVRADDEEESEEQDSELDAVQRDDYWEEDDEARPDDEEEYVEEDGEGNEFKEPKDDYLEEEDKVRADDEEESEEQDSELDAVQTDDYWEKDDEARADDKEEYGAKDGEGSDKDDGVDDKGSDEDPLLLNVLRVDNHKVSRKRRNADDLIVEGTQLGTWFKSRRTKEGV